MSAIGVSCGRLTREGQLKPSYDPDADLLAVTSESDSDWPYGIDIDGNIVFDLNASRVLANFDLHVAQRLWQKGATLDWPEGVPTGSLIFAEAALQQKSFSLPLRLPYDPDHGILRIEFGTMKASESLALSDSCVALLSNGYLVGFLIRHF